MKQTRTALLAVVSALFVSANACSDTVSPPHAPTDRPASEPAAPPASVLTNGQVLSGLDAYNENWRRALRAAELGDSVGLKSLQSLHQLIASRTPSSPPPSSRPPNTPGIGATAMEEQTVYSTSSNAVIYSSDTWPNLATSVSAGTSSLGSYVLFLGQSVTSSAEYKVSPHGAVTGDWANAGTNSSSGRRIYSLLDCVARMDATCPWFQQQDVTFGLSGIATCGVDLWGRGNHEVWFNDIPVQITVGDSPSIGFSINVPNPAQHATQANAQKSAPGVNCDDIDRYEAVGSGGNQQGGSDCPLEDQFYWLHDFGSGYQIVGEVCIQGGVITIINGVRTSPAELHSAVQQTITSAPSPANVGPGGHVTLVGADVLPDESVEIIRRAGQLPHQVILISPQAKPADLALALGTIGLMRAIAGDAISNDQTVVPRGSISLKPEATPLVARMQGYLRALRNAPSTSVNGIGPARALEITLGMTPTIQR